EGEEGTGQEGLEGWTSTGWTVAAVTGCAPAKPSSSGQHHSSHQHKAKTCTHRAPSCPWQPEHPSDIPPHLLTQSFSAHQNRMQLIGRFCVQHFSADNRISAWKEDEYSDTHLNSVASVPCLAHRSGSQEWFEEECVRWDDIQRDGNVVSSADIHTKVAAVQAECHHECPLANWIRESVTVQDNLEDDSDINRERDDSEMTAPGSTFWD
ncbi:hypothetical protein DV515_00006449, partial [Chloebia gouldiae]